jgi:hypothetical protein
MNITELARGRPCEIRVPGGCDSADTTVLCHVRMPDLSGIGFKAPDWLGAFGCRRCHDVVDGRAGNWVEFPQWARDLMLFEGTARTLVILINEGVIVVPEPAKRQAKLTKIVPRRLPRHMSEALRVTNSTGEPQ